MIYLRLISLPLVERFCPKVQENYRRQDGHEVSASGISVTPRISWTQNHLATYLARLEESYNHLQINISQSGRLRLTMFGVPVECEDGDGMGWVHPRGGAV